MTPDQLQEAMAEKRLSLRASLADLEDETQKRVRETMDYIQGRVKTTTDNIGHTVTRPIHAVNEALEKVPRTLRSKPVQTVLAVASAGIAVGYLVGRRRQHRQLTRALLATASRPAPAPQPVSAMPMPTAKTAAKGILATLAMEAAHQIVMNSLFSLLRRRH